VSVAEQKVTPPGTARADWMIAAELALRLGADLAVESPESIRAEIAAVSPVHAELTEAALADDRVEGVLISGSSIEAPTVSASTTPANDAYSLRLVAARRMYDNGTMLQASASSAGLAASVKVTLNPTDFEKLGLDAGTVVKVISGRGELMAPLAADFGVPAGSAMIPANAPGSNANTLIDASASVTDVRVERA
jgi:predicted molibdopterin-dependent oxidoreductase YjgC